MNNPSGRVRAGSLMRVSGHNPGGGRRVEEKSERRPRFMDSKAVFTQECHREAFKGLCINVLPLIGELIENARKSGIEGMVGLSMDTNGYLISMFMGAAGKCQGLTAAAL